MQKFGVQLVIWDFWVKGSDPHSYFFFSPPNKGNTGEEKTQSSKTGSKYDFMKTTAFEITYCEHTSLQHVLTLFLFFISYPQCAQGHVQCGLDKSITKDLSIPTIYTLCYLPPTKLTWKQSNLNYFFSNVTIHNMNNPCIFHLFKFL